MQIRKMADYNLVVVAITEDTRNSEPINEKNQLHSLKSSLLSGFGLSLQNRYSLNHCNLNMF